MSVATAINDRVAQANARPIYEYKLSAKLAGQCEHVKESVGLVKLTADEEMRAAERSGTNIGKLASELASACLKEVDGHELDVSKGEDVIVWNRMLPEIRSLVTTAYAKLHNAEPEEVADFLASVEIKG